MADQKATGAVAGDDVIDIAYQPVDGRPVESFSLANLLERGNPAELTRHQRLQFDMLIWCTAGAGRHEVDFEAVPLFPGRVLHIRSGQVHHWRLDDPYDAELVLVHPRRLRSDRSPGIRVIDPGDERHLDLQNAVALLERDRRSLALTPRVLESLRDLLTALLDLDLDADRDPAPGQLGSIFREFVDLLSGSEPPPRTVAACAARLGCSPRTLMRACQAVADDPPKLLLDRAIALEAQRLLGTGDVAVADVSAALGFSEISNFTRFFRRVTGVTPAAFALSTRQGA